MNVLTLRFNGNTFPDEGIFLGVAASSSSSMKLAELPAPMLNVVVPLLVSTENDSSASSGGVYVSSPGIGVGLGTSGLSGVGVGVGVGLGTSGLSGVGVGVGVGLGTSGLSGVGVGVGLGTSGLEGVGVGVGLGTSGLVGGTGISPLSGLPSGGVISPLLFPPSGGVKSPPPPLVEW